MSSPALFGSASCTSSTWSHSIYEGTRSRHPRQNHAGIGVESLALVSLVGVDYRAGRPCLLGKYRRIGRAKWRRIGRRPDGELLLNMDHHLGNSLCAADPG